MTRILNPIVSRRALIRPRKRNKTSELVEKNIEREVLDTGSEILTNKIEGNNNNIEKTIY